jgi:hypothetical protein
MVTRGLPAIWEALARGIGVNESLRNKRTSWRPLGYIYDMAQHGGKHPMVTTDRKRPRKLKPVEKCLCHHQILQKLIESHITIQ